MSKFFLLIFIGLSILCKAQITKKSERINCKGLIIFSFVPDAKMKSYYCALKPQIIIDSIKYDFVSGNSANYYIIKQNPEFEKILGKAESFQTDDFEAVRCVYRSFDELTKKMNCDSILTVYQNNNIYDPFLFKKELDERMIFTYSSESIYSYENSDTVSIVIQFLGTVIKYHNISYGNQYDERYYEDEEGFVEFDDSHSVCPFEKYNSTLIVLDKVKKIEKPTNSQIKKLKLKKSKFNKIQTFIYY